MSGSGPSTARRPSRSAPSPNAYRPQLLRQAPQQVADHYLRAESWYAWAEHRAVVGQLGPRFLLAPGRLRAGHPLAFDSQHPLRVC